MNQRDEPLTPNEERELRERWSLAMPGPWYRDEHSADTILVPVSLEYVVHDLRPLLVLSEESECDAEAIAAAPVDVARLLATLDAARAERDAHVSRIAIWHGDALDILTRPKTGIQVGVPEMPQSFVRRFEHESRNWLGDSLEYYFKYDTEREEERLRLAQELDAAREERDAARARATELEAALLALVGESSQRAPLDRRTLERAAQECEAYATEQRQEAIARNARTWTVEDGFAGGASAAASRIRALADDDESGVGEVEP